MKEIIKAIPGWNGYHVSDQGKVYSQWVQSHVKGNRGLVSSLSKEMREMTQVEANGRMQVNLCFEGKRKTFRVHHLVLITFVGPRPRNMEACHFPDGSTKNNKLNNLRWDTKKANYSDRIHHGTTNDGERNGGSRLIESQVIQILDMRKQNKTLAGIASLFNVSIMTIQNICSNKSWKNIKRED